MAKFFGNIGFEVTQETVPGVWKEVIVPYPYYGDFTRNHMRPKETEKLNDDITLSNEISIIADPFARENFCSMKYVEYMGAKWKVTSVDVQYPRLVISVGGVYNG